MSRETEEREGVHYYLYWYLKDGTQWGMANAFQNYYNMVETMLEETGREFYEIWINDPKFAGFYTIKREDLLKIEN